MIKGLLLYCSNFKGQFTTAVEAYDSFSAYRVMLNFILSKELYLHLQRQVTRIIVIEVPESCSV